MKTTWSRTLFRAFRLRLRLRRRAFRCIFARSAIASFAKDAAPIPNAKGRRRKTEKPQRNAEASVIGWRRPTFPQLNAVSSALRGLTSLFGMGRGGPPRYSHRMCLWMS